MMKFSLLISIYYKETPEYFAECLTSVSSQSAMPDEIIIVEDGPIDQKLSDVIARFEPELPIVRVPIKKNLGLGRALNIGLERCLFDYVARLDSDDVCNRERFSKQLGFLIQNPEVDIVGSNLSYFDGDKITGERVVPVINSEIVLFAKKRNPMSHTTVMFKKSAVLKCGGYPPARFAQDYLLWIELIKNKCIFANIPENLVHMRRDGSMLKRRGINNFKYDVAPYFRMLEYGQITILDAISSVLSRFCFALMPNVLKVVLMKMVN